MLALWIFLVDFGSVRIDSMESYLIEQLRVPFLQVSTL